MTLVTTHYQRKKRLVPNGIFLNKTLDHMLSSQYTLPQQIVPEGYCLVTVTPTGHTLMELRFFY